MGWLYRRLVVPRILKKCKKIITVSDYEKNNIMTKLGIPEERMAMIYNGYNEWFKPVHDIQHIYQRYIDSPGYFFFLGNTDPKKNTERTLIAYYRSQKEYRTHTGCLFKISGEIDCEAEAPDGRS